MVDTFSAANAAQQFHSESGWLSGGARASGPPARS